MDIEDRRQDVDIMIYKTGNKMVYLLNSGYWILDSNDSCLLSTDYYLPCSIGASPQ